MTFLDLHTRGPVRPWRPTFRWVTLLAVASLGLVSVAAASAAQTTSRRQSCSTSR
jgi:hypothetical protein